MKTNNWANANRTTRHAAHNLTKTFYYNITIDLCAHTYHVVNCPREHVELVCSMLGNLAKLYELETVNELYSCSGLMEDVFYGYNDLEEEILAAEFDLTTLCYPEHIAIYSICLERKDLANLADGYHKTIPEYTYNKREF